MKKSLVRKKHPLAIRWFHWINFPVLAVMIWSGLLIYWANDIYNIKIGNKVLYHFFSKSFYVKYHLSYRLAEGMSFHFAFMWLFFLNGLLYVTYTLFSGEWKYLVPDKHSFRESWLVLLHELHIRRSAPGQLKYNAAQRVAYTAIIFMGMGSIITGLAIYKPVQFNTLCWLCGGYGPARVEHFILTLGYVIFFLVHVLQVMMAGWNNFQAMITGFEFIPHPTKQSENEKPLE